ncbi:Transcription factor MYB44 [Porphyridium purpureum]|uniref:Transcription factor MYB44 n=1 Tax=Porphyridium purpureum TaxID=35688 RepID=A0A5J4YKJ9_PORPP|nr:Transcription factor MYB44 [Porphyridium purpureum]|eukprot:POR3605..scf291_13
MRAPVGLIEHRRAHIWCDAGVRRGHRVGTYSSGTWKADRNQVEQTVQNGRLAGRGRRARALLSDVTACERGSMLGALRGSEKHQFSHMEIPPSGSLARRGNPVMSVATQEPRTSSMRAGLPHPPLYNAHSHSGSMPLLSPAIRSVSSDTGTAGSAATSFAQMYVGSSVPAAVSMDMGAPKLREISTCSPPDSMLKDGFKSIPIAMLLNPGMTSGATPTEQESTAMPGALRKQNSGSGVPSSQYAHHQHAQQSRLPSVDFGGIDGRGRLGSGDSSASHPGAACDGMIKQERSPGGSGPCMDSNKNARRIKHFWMPEEDDLVLELVERHGPRNWDQLATHFPLRTGQQVRLRYNNYLRYSEQEKHAMFTPEQDRIIMEAGQQGSRKWSVVARDMGRSYTAQRSGRPIEGHENGQGWRWAGIDDRSDGNVAAAATSAGAGDHSALVAAGRRRWREPPHHMGCPIRSMIDVHAM